MGVLGATFLRGKDPDRLVRRTDGVIELAGILNRHYAVVAAVSYEERTGDLFSHILKREFLGDLDAFFLSLRTDHPAAACMASLTELKLPPGVRWVTARCA